MSMDGTRTLYSGRYLRLAAKDGWEYVERTNPQGAVIVVAVTPAAKVLMVEQHRVPLDCRTLEFPAGLIGDEPGLESELIELAAQRELLEETGWSAQRIEYLMGGPSSAGMSTEIMHFVRAFGLQRVHAGGGTGNENIIVHEVPLDQIATYVADHQQRGYAIDPKVYAGLYFLERDAWGQRWDEEAD
jgi:ADP-ribose pyrophosphatase